MKTVLLWCIALATMLFASLAFAQVAPPDPSANPMAFIEQILAALQAHNWLFAVPMAAIGAIWCLRNFGAAKLPWLGTDQGGAVIALGTAAAEACIAAAALPGTHAVVATALWILITLCRNKLLFVWLGKLGLDLSVDPPMAAKKPTPPPAPAGVVVPLLLALALFAAPSSARASVTYDFGVTAGFDVITATNQNPVAVAPGAGYQFELSLSQLNTTILTKTFSIASLRGMALGTMLPGLSSKAFGALGAGLGVCIFGVACAVPAKIIIDTNNGLLGIRDGWALAFQLGFKFGWSSPAPTVGADGVVTPPQKRGDTVYLF